MCAQVATPELAVKSCDPQLLTDEHPDGKWGKEELGSYAQSQYKAIVSGEESLTPRYWRLGMALNLARKSLQHGHWQKYIRSLGIDKSRAARARAIHETFNTIEEVAGLTVDKAYARRVLRKPKQRRGNQKFVRTEAPLATFLKTLRDRTRVMIEAADSAEPQLAAKLLPVVSEAMSRLTTLKQSLERQAQGSESRLPLPARPS